LLHEVHFEILFSTSFPTVRLFTVEARKRDFRQPAFGIIDEVGVRRWVSDHGKVGSGVGWLREGPSTHGKRPRNRRGMGWSRIIVVPNNGLVGGEPGR
jgi:hypothetical protein